MVPTTVLVGRDGELEHLGDLVAPGRLVTITGPGGVGKTSLALAFAHAASRWRAFDPTAEVVIAPLVEVEPDGDVAAVSHQLGFASPEAAVLSLGGRPVLVVLDNCEHLRNAAADLVRALLAPASPIAVLATSREPLRVRGERVVGLSPLAVPSRGAPELDDSPSVQLFLSRAGAAGADWAMGGRADGVLETVAELCRRLDGLPLAIEIAAARSRAVGPVELLRLMEHRLDLLQVPGEDGSSPRHHSVRAAIDVSVELLSPDDATAFRRLGVFAGPFDLDLAHAVIAAPDDPVLDTVDVLGRLVDRSLVEVTHVQGSTRYQLLELIREHAREASVDAGHWDDSRRRFVDAMDATSERIVVEALADWRGELLAEATAQFRNLAAAIEWAVELDAGPERALRLMRPLLVAVHQGRSIDVLHLGERLFGRWPDEPAPWRAEILGVLATGAAVVADLDRLRQLATASLEDPDGSGIATVLAERALALAEIGEGRPAEARAHLERARAAATGSGLGPFERELAGVTLAVRHMEGAGAALLDEVDGLAVAARAAGDAVNEGLAEIVRAQVLGSLGRWDDAERAVLAASRVTEAGGYAWWTRAVRRVRAELAAARAAVSGGDPWASSAPYWRQAVEQAAERGALGELATTLLAAAVVAWRADARSDAAVLVGAAPSVVELSVIPDVPRATLDEVVAAVHRGDVPRPASLLAGVRDALAVLDAGGGGEDRAAVDDPEVGALRQDGDSWVVTFRGSSTRLRPLKGLDDLCVLLATPGVEVHALSLMGGVDVAGGVAGLDDTARRAYEAQIVDLQAEIDDAREANDLVRAERAELELDALVAELSATLGIGGRARTTGSSAERARSAVTYRIRAAIKRIAEANPELGRHLTNAVRTGTWCSYQPETPVRWDTGGAVR